MRRRTLQVRNARVKGIVYTASLGALIAYAVPRMPALQPGISGTFSMIWLLFAGLAIAANLYFAFGADRERSKMLEMRDVGAGIQPRNRVAEKGAKDQSALPLVKRGRLRG